MRCGRRKKQIQEDARKMHPTTFFVDFFFWKNGRRHLEGHDLVRRMDRQGQVQIWCRTCSGYARPRMGPKLMNCCKPGQMGTKEFGKMLKLIQQVFEDGRVPAKEARSWRIKGQKRKNTKKKSMRGKERVT